MPNVELEMGTGRSLHAKRLATETSLRSTQPVESTELRQRAWRHSHDECRQASRPR